MVSQGQHFDKGDVLIILEAMKMETEIRASQAGTIIAIKIKEGDTVKIGDSLLAIQ